MNAMVVYHLLAEYLIMKICKCRSTVVNANVNSNYLHGVVGILMFPYNIGIVW